jgi:hypothetical protein
LDEKKGKHTTPRAKNTAVWQNDKMILTVFCQTPPVFFVLPHSPRFGQVFLSCFLCHRTCSTLLFAFECLIFKGKSKNQRAALAQKQKDTPKKPSALLFNIMRLYSTATQAKGSKTKAVL